MVKTKADPAQHMRMISVVPLERPGVMEFSAWELARWLGIWMKPFNQKMEIPHLAFLDCPTARQITFRFLVLHGQAELPWEEKEEWSYLGLQVWPTRRSFGTLWLSNSCFSKKEEPDRGRLKARVVEKEALGEPDVKMEEEQELFIP